jgi:Putative zinc-finger
MTECCDEGLLRAYLEGANAPPGTDLAAIEAHLAGCGECRARLDGLRKLDTSVMSRMTMLAPSQPADVQLALQKMRLKLREERGALRSGAAIDQHAMGMSEKSRLPSLEGVAPDAGGSPPANHNRRKTMQSLSFIRPGQRRALFSGLAAAMLVLSMAVFPSVRAAADSLLQTFRAKSVLFVPVDTSRLQQLSKLRTDPTALFMTKPSIVGEKKYMPVNSLDEAAAKAGFTPEQPASFPGKAMPDSTQIKVYDKVRVEAQVDVDNIRQVLSALNVNDVTLPDALGSSPISADVPPFVEASYSGTGYELHLVQGHSPTVTLPKGVNLAQLGEVGLRVIGMQPDQARELSRQIDWSSTLVVPFPADLSDVARVQVGDAQGLMVTAGSRFEGGNQSGRDTIIYWQRGDRFFALQGTGSQVNNDVMLLVAKSVR